MLFLYTASENSIDVFLQDGMMDSIRNISEVPALSLVPVREQKSHLRKIMIRKELRWAEILTIIMISVSVGKILVLGILRPN